MLANPEKQVDMGLADVVLGSVNALKRKFRHSSVPKDGTEGNDDGAEGISSSLFTPCCTKLVRLLLARCPSMTVSTRPGCFSMFYRSE